MPEYQLTRDEMIGRCGMKKGDRVTLTEMQAKPFGDALVRVVDSNAIPVDSFQEQKHQAPDLPPAPKPDDLTTIKGISAARQETLNGMGIFQYGQLRNADPVQVSMAISGVNANMVKAWQLQAELAMTKS